MLASRKVIYLIGFIRPFQCLKETRKKSSLQRKNRGNRPLFCFQPGTDHLQLFGPFWGVSSLETTGFGLIGSDFHAHWAECPPFSFMEHLTVFK